MSTPTERVLTALRTATGVDPKQNGVGFTCRCPSHDDQNPSLSVSEGDDGRALVKCFAGCTVEQVMAELGLGMKDLMPDDHQSGPAPRRTTPRKRQPKVHATAPAALATYERQLGTCSTVSDYVDGSGEIVGKTIRWNLPEGKEIRPMARRGTGWVCEAMPQPRPLYRLLDLADAQRVYITEGEKAAEGARSLGLVATTSAGGCKAAAKSDWSPLAGKQAVILPDHDEPGRKYADSVVDMLHKLAQPPTIKILHMPNIPKHGDIVDYIESHDSRDDDDLRRTIEAMVDAAAVVESVKAEAEAETGAPRLQWKPFPTHVLPSPLRELIEQGAKAIGCDESAVALPALAVVASAIGNSRCLRLKRGWTEAAILWAAVVAESGDVKSPPFRLAVGPLRDRQRRRLEEHTYAMEGHDADMLRFERDRKNWKGQGDPPVKPEPPAAVRYVVSDATIEAIAPILLANPRGLLLAVDELNTFFGSFDRYAGRGGGDEGKWLAMHGPDSILIDRKTGPSRTIHVPKAACSITGTIQPGVLHRAMGVQHRESGLLARILLAMPPVRKRVWTEAVVDASVEHDYGAMLDRLLALRGDVDGAEPLEIPLTPDGKAAWLEFFREHAEGMYECHNDVRSAWSKLEGGCARFALVHHLGKWAGGPMSSDPGAVGADSVEAGATLSRWFRAEAERVYSAIAESPEDREERTLVERIRAHGGSVSVRDLTHGQRRYRGRTDEARAALQALADTGVGRWKYLSSSTKGGPQTKRLELVTGVTVTTTTADGVATGGCGDGDGGDAPTNTSDSDRSRDTVETVPNGSSTEAQNE